MKYAFKRKSKTFTYTKMVENYIDTLPTRLSLIYQYLENFPNVDELIKATTGYHRIYDWIRLKENTCEFHPPGSFSGNLTIFYRELGLGNIRLIKDNNYKDLEIYDIYQKVDNK